MKRRITEIFQYICISFTVIIMVSALLSICQFGLESGFYAKFLVEVFLLLVVCWAVSIGINRMEFMQNLSQRISLFVAILLEYIEFLLFGFLFKWFTFDVKNMIVYTISFLVIEFLIRRAFQRKWKVEEDHINDVLRKRNQ